MDKSEKYRLMCEKAPKLQPSEIKQGDFYAFQLYPNTTYSDVEISTLNQPREFLIRLHRQDQLQKMIFDSKNHSCIYYLYRFRNWIVEEKSIEGIEAQNWSMEQLWLAFVMAKKYQKTWNGEDWVSNGYNDR